MAEQAKQPKPKAQGRISPTEALRIMMTRMAAPRGVQRLTEAIHDWKCRIWRDGKLVPRAEVGHLSVLENYHDETGQYHASIGDDRWDAVRGEYELDADEVMELLQKAEAVQTAAAAAEEARAEAATARAALEQARVEMQAAIERMEQAEARVNAAEEAMASTTIDNGQRRKPGPKPKYPLWRLEAATFVDRFFKKNTRMPSAGEVAEHLQIKCDGWEPHPTDIRDLLKLLRPD